MVGKTSLGTTDDDEMRNDIFRLDFFTLKLNRKIGEKIDEKIGEKIGESW